MSSTVRTGIGALMLALGLLWFGQGMGWIGDRDPVRPRLGWPTRGIKKGDRPILV